MGESTGLRGPGLSRRSADTIEPVTIPSLAILLVLGCALTFSGVDISRKLLASWVRPVPLLFALAGGMAPFFIVWYLQEGAPIPAPGYWVPGLASTLINVAL